MTALITRLEALRADLLAKAAWHADRGNTESAALARAKAAGIALALDEIAAPTTPTLS
jgi:hypothetical protein